MTDKQRIEQEAERLYIKGSASYVAFILGAEFVMKNERSEEYGIQEN
jgi:hypothetical protein